MSELSHWLGAAEGTNRSLEDQVARLAASQQALAEGGCPLQGLQVQGSQGLPGGLAASTGRGWVPTAGPVSG